MVVWLLVLLAVKIKLENWIERGLNIKDLYYFSTLNRRAEAKL